MGRVERLLDFVDSRVGVLLFPWKEHREEFFE